MAAFVALSGCFPPFVSSVAGTGLGIIVNVASFEESAQHGHDLGIAYVAGFFVFVSGIRAVAWVRPSRTF